MNAKEKAKELVDKFYPHAMVNSSGFLVSNEDTVIKSAKQCAIICVDEIIKSNPHRYATDTWVILNIDYWKEVKTEIQNL